MSRTVRRSRTKPGGGDPSAESRPRVVATLLVAFLLLPGNRSWAQLAEPNGAGVAMGHVHYLVRDVEANKRFWMELGGQPTEIDGTEALRFADVFVFLMRAESTGGSDGAVLNHVAFRVPSFAALEARGIAVQPVRGFPGVGSVTSPEGERIELFEDAATNLTFTFDTGRSEPAAERHNRPLPVPIAFHHVHLYLPEGAVADAKAWYVETFGGIPGKRGVYEAVDLPGINFNFSDAPRPVVPTKGRMLDHIGFEVVDLEAFCRRLQAMGVTFDVPYTRQASGIAFARLTDPWGTSIELTEGLRGR